MSTTVLPDRAAVPVDSAAPGLRGLFWLVLRQNRLLLWTLGTLLILAVADLLWIHIACSRIVSDLRRTDCYDPETWDRPQCWNLLQQIDHPNFWYLQVLQPAVTALPLLIGVFIGAPLLAQEYERGTIRLIRAQSVSPIRWLAVRLAVPGLAVLAASGVLAVLMTWVWWTDIVHGPVAFDPPFQFFTYPALGLAPIAWSLFALILGVLVGQLVRRTLPAMFLTGALVAATHGLVLWARPSFYPAVDRVAALRTTHPTNSWLLDRGVVLPDGTRVSTSSCGFSFSTDCDGATASWLRYHPADHLVPVQLVEAGILVALTLALLVVVFRRIRA
ncbi:ABC transporter permease [Kitasatospora sp. NPDC057542]|uniref:ABC transporter permease n=1 Tax=Streptomycetaceae TaxID=2062 RepID=UPI001CCD79CA|nr:ABC transporter permease [Streptomyces sp. LS1784]